MRRGLPHLIWSFAALLCFALLQLWRIETFDTIQRELRPGVRVTVSPVLVTRLAPWLDGVAALQQRTGENVFQVLPSLRRLREERPWALPAAAGLSVGLGVCGWAGAVGLCAVLCRRARVLPYALDRATRKRIAERAARMVWAWGVLWGAIIGCAAWFIGFDRSGRSITLLDGLLPAMWQAALIAAAWAAVTGSGAAAAAWRACALMLDEPARRAAAICVGCGYPLYGLSPGADRCPECGAAINAVGVRVTPAAPSTWGLHAALARRTAVACVAAVTLWGAGVASGGRCGRWLQLEPAEIGYPGVVGTLMPDGAQVTAASIYGSVRLSARRTPGSDPAGPGDWVVTWRFVPDPGRGLDAASGEARLGRWKNTGGGPGRSLTVSLPFGELQLIWRPTEPGRLYAQGAAVIYRP